MGQADIQVIMRSTKHGYVAVGIYDGMGVTVLAGSQVSPILHDSIMARGSGNSTLEMRERFVDDNFRTIEDVYFKSPSAASNFVCGHSSNGWVEWTTPNGVKLSAYRDIKKAQSDQLQVLIPPAVIADAKRNGQDHKQDTEKKLLELIGDDKNIWIESKDRHTAVYYRGKIIASIYYRANAIRIEMPDTDAVHALYEDLRSESIAYQKTSADPYATSGKYAFFVNSEDEETALLTLVIAAQEGRLTSAASWTESKKETSISHEVPAKPVSDLHALALGHPLIAQPEIEQTADDRLVIYNTEAKKLDVEQPAPVTYPGEIPNHSTAVSEQKVVVVRATEENKRLERKLDSLLGALVNMYSEKSAPQEAETTRQEIDKRYRIEPTDGNAPYLILKSKPIITGLIFAINICAVGTETSAERYKIFFSSKDGELLSDPQVIDAVAGEEYNCRFMLKSLASEEKKVFLAVQGINAVSEEVRQLIEFSIKIAFSADFGL